MSKGKEVMAMGVEGEDDHSDGGRKRKSRSANQDSPKRLKIQQDLNRSPKQEEEELLFEKELTSKDVRQWQLIISGAKPRQRVLKALREDEKKKARGSGGLSVATTDADGVEYKLILRNAHYMTLTDQWTMIIHKYKPNAGDSVQVFGSRDAADDHFRLRLHFIAK